MAAVGGSQEQEADPARARRHNEHLRSLLAIEREELIGLRGDGTISDETLRYLERELDLAELRLTSVGRTFS